MVESRTPNQDGLNSFGFMTPVQFIANLLIDLRENYFMGQSQENESVRNKIQYCLEKLNNKQSLFQVDPDLSQSNEVLSVQSSLMDAVEESLIRRLMKKEPNLKISRTNRRRTVMIGQRSWLSEYSSINMDIIHQKAILSHNNRTISCKSEVSKSVLSPKPHSFQTIQTSLVKDQALFQSATSVDFNIFKFVSEVGRRNSLTYLVMHLLR